MAEEAVVERDTVDPTTMSDDELKEAYESASSEPETVEESAPETQEAEQAVEETPTEEPQEESEVAKLQARIAEQEKMIGSQSSQIGELRKLAEMQKSEPEAADDGIEKLREIFEEDPIKGIQMYESMKSEQQRKAEAMQQYEELQNQNLIKEKIPEFGDLVNDMTELAKQDGLDDMTIRNLLNRPYATNHLATTYNLAQRAMQVRHVASLQAEIDSLKGKADSVLDKVEQAANNKPSVSAKSGQPAPQQKINASDPTSLSDDDLKAELERRRNESVLV